MQRGWFCTEASMLHEQYEDLDPDYRATIFMGRSRLLSSVESHTLLPDNRLNARSLLVDSQMQVVKRIRTRRLEPVLDRFQPD